MTAGTTSRRPYDSSSRLASAQRNRRTIIEACRELLLQDGYQTTTLRGVAARAGVSVETIYKTFGGKPQLVKAVYDVAIADGDDLVPPADRPEIQYLQSISDPAGLVQAHAHLVTSIHGRLGGLLTVFAESGAEVEEISRTAEAERRDAVAGIVGRLAGEGFLTTGLSRQRAVEAYWAISSAGIYVRLVRDLHWKPEEYAAWLTSMIMAILRPGGN